MNKKNEKSTLSIEFENEEARQHFAIWLCEQGEQDYWEWMECREEEEDGPITAVGFDYFPNEAKEFIEHGLVQTNCGRLDDSRK